MLKMIEKEDKDSKNQKDRESEGFLKDTQRNNQKFSLNVDLFQNIFYLNSKNNSEDIER